MWKINCIQNYTMWLFISKYLDNLKLLVTIIAFVNIMKLEMTKWYNQLNLQFNWSKNFNNKRRLAKVKIVYCYKIYFLRKYILYKRKLTLWTELKKTSFFSIHSIKILKKHNTLIS